MRNRCLSATLLLAWRRPLRTLVRPTSRARFLRANITAPSRTTNAVLEHIKPGEVIFTRTLDSGGQDEKDEHRSRAGQSADRSVSTWKARSRAMRSSIHFRKVRLNRNWGFSAWRLGLIALTPEYVEKISTPTSTKPIWCGKGATISCRGISIWRAGRCSCASRSANEFRSSFPRGRCWAAWAWPRRETSRLPRVRPAPMAATWITTRSARAPR